MDSIVNKLIDYIKKNDIKIVTINESNHRSYTSHTFHFKLAKALYINNIIDTFSSERMGIHDGEIINEYLEKNKNLTTLKKNLIFGGMGYYRIIKYLSKKPFNSYKIVGLEKDYYCQKAVDNLKKFNNLTDYNDKGEREEFWLKNIKKILKERDNLFINGFHLSKNDLIGKYLKKKYGKKALFISMAAFNIKTQLLLIDRKKYPKVDDFDTAIYTKNYETKIENVERNFPATNFEKLHKNWKLVKVDKNNKNNKTRHIGCYLALYKDEYKNNINISKEITQSLDGYDFCVFFKTSQYKEEMFY